MRQLHTWKLILQSLREHIPVMLLYVLESSGSSPGRQGFFMAINTAGVIEGSVGGGIMEHKFAEMAKEKLRTSTTDSILRKQFHSKSSPKDQSGMICSGEQTIWLYHVQTTDAFYVEQLVQCLEENKNGHLKLSPSGIYFSADSVPASDYYFSMTSEDDWVFEEKAGYKNKLFIVGGGHCALAFSRLMSTMDFYIRLYETRPELHTLLQNNYVHEAKLVPAYDELTTLIPSGSNHYVVLMTLSYRTDAVALRAVINHELRYLGLLGSKSKIDEMLMELRSEGIAEGKIERIHSPIGIPIRSQTPEEIAVSIAAEIIRVKNEG